VTAPQYEADAIDRLCELLLGRRVIALTGAGVSTESGIPDYRSPEALARSRTPIQGPEFARSPDVRRRYWARAMVGWERFREARPGPAHVALAKLERAGIVTDVITQNVDRLHHAAGSKRVVELHGALAEVRCTECGVLEDRDSVQARMRAENPWPIEVESTIAPDGDAELTDDVVSRFQVPECVACGGILKPRVVFFGDNVPSEIVDDAFQRLDSGNALLVCGTSLAVFSGYRFLRRAAERFHTIVIVNRGPVRGQEKARLVIEGSTGEILSEAARRLTG
jgi:NAD-dependent SIR2 family protein deacetylase